MALICFYGDMMISVRKIGLADDRELNKNHLSVLFSDCYIMPAARAYLQISLGKTRSTPTSMHELMTTHVAVKDHVTP